MDSMGNRAMAKRAGVGIDTVRYYEREGLLKPMQRLASGYRRYSQHEVSRLRFIHKAQAPGFTLREIRELLALSSPGHGRPEDCPILLALGGEDA